MKRDHILNASVIRAVAAIGHTQSLMICDAGLPIPAGVPCIDLSLVRGIPSFQDVLEAVAAEMVIERAILATETSQKNPGVVNLVCKILPEIPIKEVPHSKLKSLSQDALTIIRTGECTPFANVLLVAGVNF